MLKIDHARIDEISKNAIPATAWIFVKANNGRGEGLQTYFSPVLYCPVVGFTMLGSRDVGSSENVANIKRAADCVPPAIAPERRASMVRSLESQAIAVVDLRDMTNNGGVARGYWFINTLRARLLEGAQPETFTDIVGKLYAGYDQACLDAVQPSQNARDLVGKLTMIVAPRDLYVEVSAAGYASTWRAACNELHGIAKIEGDSLEQRRKCESVFLEVCKNARLNPIDLTMDILERMTE